PSPRRRRRTESTARVRESKSGSAGDSRTSRAETMNVSGKSLRRSASAGSTHPTRLSPMRKGGRRSMSRRWNGRMRSSRLMAHDSLDPSHCHGVHAIATFSSAIVTSSSSVGRSSLQSRGPTWLWLAVAAIGVTGLVIALNGRFPGAFQDSNQVGRLAYLMAWLVLGGSGVVLAVRRQQPLVGLRNAAIWIGIGLALVIG